MKNIVPVVIVIAILLLIGNIIVKGEIDDLEKGIEESAKTGDYYTVIANANEIEFQGKKMSKKVKKLVEDVKLFQAAENEMEKYSDMNLGKVKAILDEMNGSYKKYDQFKSDVKDLKETVKELEEYGNLGVELVEKIEKLLEKGENEEVRDLIREYESDERYEYMPSNLKDALFEYMNQASGIS